MVKDPPTMWDTWVQSLGWEDPLKEGMATTPVFLPGGASWTKEPGGLQALGHKESETTEQLSTFPNGDPFFQIPFSLQKQSHCKRNKPHGNTWGGKRIDSPSTPFSTLCQHPSSHNSHISFPHIPVTSWTATLAQSCVPRVWSSACPPNPPRVLCHRLLDTRRVSSQMLLHFMTYTCVKGITLYSLH